LRCAPALLLLIQKLQHSKQYHSAIYSNAVISFANCCGSRTALLFGGIGVLVGKKRLPACQVGHRFVGQEE
jgi:nucleoside permease NupC